MDRITATADDLMRQAHETAEVYLSHALRWVKAHDLPQQDWSTYVGIYVQAATQDFLAAAVLAGLQDASAEVESAMMHLVDATREGLEQLGHTVHDLVDEIPQRT